MNHLALKITRDGTGPDNESYIGVSCPYCGGQKLTLGGNEAHVGYRMKCITCSRNFWVKMMHIKTKPTSRTTIQRWSGRKADDTSTEM